MNIRSIAVLWLGGLVALIQSSYHLLLAGLEAQKISVLADINLASESLYISVKSHLYQASISLFFLFCFSYVIFLSINADKSTSKDTGIRK